MPPKAKTTQAPPKAKGARMPPNVKAAHEFHPGRPFLHETPLPYHEARARMAKHIRNGGLAVPQKWDQINPASFSLLADINDGGMLTTDSQDAIDPVPVQRAYVEGLMLPEQARAYIKWLNVNTEMVAFAMDVMYSDNSRATSEVYNSLLGLGIAVTRTREGAAAGEWMRTTSVAPVAADKWDRMAFEMRVAFGLLPQKDEVVFVISFDPVWGRAASSKGGLFPAVIRALKGGMLRKTAM